VGDFIAGNSDAAVGGDIEPTEQIEQSRLAGAAGTHEGDEIALVYVKVQPLQDLNFLATTAVGFVQATHLDEAIGSSAAIDSNHV
jgi:hypothetical protein